jgi:hypothetical protein
MKSRVGKKALSLLETGLALHKYTLATKAYCDIRTSYAALKRLHKLRLIYICGWHERPFSRIPIYALGNKVDKPKPSPMTIEEKNRKRLNDPEYMINEMMRKRAKRIIERVGI